MSIILYTPSAPTSDLVETMTVPTSAVSFTETKMVFTNETGGYLSTSITLIVTEALLERFGDRLS